MDLKEAREEIVNYLRNEIGYLNQSVDGERPDEEGEYTESRGIIKETRDTIYSIINIFDVTDETLSSFNSLEDYLKASAERVYAYPEGASKPVIAYLEKKFGIKLDKPEGPSLYYKYFMNGTAESLNLDVEELKELIPYEEFEKLKSGEATEIIFRHFKLD